LHACWSADFHLPRAKKLILVGIGLLSTRWRFSYACLFFHQVLFFIYYYYDKLRNFSKLGCMMYLHTINIFKYNHIKINLSNLFGIEGLEKTVWLKTREQNTSDMDFTGGLVAKIYVLLLQN
jgi:hypothetical protein